MKKIIICFLACFIILAPYLVIDNYLHYDSKRIIQLFILGMVGICVLIDLYLKRKNQSSVFQIDGSSKISKHLSLAICVLVIAGTFSVFFAEYVREALLEFSFFFLLLSLVFIIQPTNRKSHAFLGKAIIVSSVAYSCFYLVLFFGNYVSHYFDPMMALWPNKYHFSFIIEGKIFQGAETLFFTHKRFFNHTQTWSLPILVGFVCYYRVKYPDEKLIYYALLLLTSFWWMLIIASGGRGSTLSIVASIILLTIVWKRDLYPFLKQMGLSLALGTAIYFTLFKLIPSGQQNVPLLRTSDSGRLNMWEGALQSWYNNPFFGIGPMHYSMIDSTPSFAHPHNFYIQFLTEWGLIAFVALAILILIIGKFLMSHYPSNRQKFQSKFLYISATWALTAAFIHAFFSGVFHTPMSQIWFVLIISWILGFKKKETAEYRQLNYQKIASFSFSILLLIVSVLVFDELINIYSGYEDYISKYPDSKFYPRFWGQGLIE